MTELTTRGDCAVLLPGGSRALFVVLFWRSSDPAASAMRRDCAGIIWPRCFRPVSVDLDSAPEIAEWYNLSVAPMLGVVTDAALLAIEHECTTEACRKLADYGWSQYSMMKTSS